VNVWLALAHNIHPHHRAAKAWEETLAADAVMAFCRFTQLGLLRLLTNSSAMGVDVMTQTAAWAVYDSLVAAGPVEILNEPGGFDLLFRRQTTRNEVSTKQWADGYLEAFSIAANIPLVTFDRALAARVAGSVLLG
jgi:toxin-antitoxin system PIN domain toxin